MRLTRVYVNAELAAGALTLDADASHHLTQVLRLRAGDAIQLFDGRGTQAQAQIAAVHKKMISVAVQSCQQISRESPLQLTLAQGISRGERMDYTIQKAVELGVNEIVPLLTERSTVKLDAPRARSRQQHWQKIIINACEQCGRAHLPKLHAVMPLSQWFAYPLAGCKMLLVGGGNNSLAGLESAPVAATLLIGPEGGLSAAEIHAAQHAGYTPLTLGARTLRTETAALAALSALQTLWGDFK